MKTLHKQLVLNKREDFGALFMENTVFSGDSITLAPGMGSGVVCLSAVDSGEKGFDWRRITLDCHVPRDSLIMVWARASDDRWYGESPDADEFLKALTPNDGISVKKLDGMYTLLGRGDDCITSLSGRYLWLMFRLMAADAPPVLSACRIHVEGDHMTDYLPAVYAKDDGFTKRFMSVFDSLLMDMERSIYDLPARFDYENTSPEMLDQLAGWMCVDTGGLTQKETAQRIRTAASDYEDMYTVAGIKRSVERLTGRTPVIIESADVDPNRPGCNDSELYRTLYGDDPYRFFILLPENTFATRGQTEAFLSDMKGLIPANTEFELVLLKGCVQLDRHTYLGINAYVSDYVPVVIDENTTIHYDTIIGGN